MTAANLRAQMPITRRYAYFDHAAVAPLPQPTADAINRWLSQATELGDTVWPEWAKQVEGTRGAAARLINADPTELALVPNTTAGINLVAQGYPWQAGDNVVTLANEFPSNQYPWLSLAARGVETRRVDVLDGRVDLQRVEDACDERTRILAISWVGYASGWRIDVDEVSELCRRRGCLLMLDAIQGLGVFPLDVQKTRVDFLAADGHKWLLGPENAGLFYLRREHLDLLAPLGAGWNSVVQRYDFGQIEWRPRPEAARYEGGTQNMAGFIGLGASLELLLAQGAGPEQNSLGERVMTLNDYAAEQLTAAGAELISPHASAHRSGILTFRWRKADPMTLRSQLASAGIVVSSRGGGLRLSPHAYNTEAEIDRLVETLRRA
jgi:selenocysteine lyase/cysteine desulfurase